MNNQAKHKNSLLETTIPVDPVAVIYNLENSDIEQFVYNYLAKTCGIDRVVAVRAHVSRTGTQRPDASLYAFISMDSNDVQTNIKNVASHLRDRIDIGGYRASNKLFDALRPIVSDMKIHAQSRERVVFIKLNLFDTIGLMLAADRNAHRIIINEIAKIKKDRFVFSVIKSNTFIEKESPSANYDKFQNIISQFED